MIPYIIETISLLLDGILTNFFPYQVNNLSLFTPLLSLVSIFLIYPFYRKDKKKYLINIFIYGIIYDLFYTNLLFWNACIFLIIGLLTIFIYKNYEISLIKIIIPIIVIITTYELLNASIIWIFQLVPLTFTKVIYKITHTLLLNIIYAEVIYFIITIIPNKYKKISIN